MNGLTTMLVVLGLSGAARAPDLEVEARTAAGASHPELAEAVARALVAGGARVVLKAPTSPPCLYCTKVAVVETRDGCTIEVSQDRRRATAALRLPASSPLLDRARAIAIQARLLMTWSGGSEARAKDARVASRKGESRTEGPATEPAAPSVAEPAAPPPVPAPPTAAPFSAEAAPVERPAPAPPSAPVSASARPPATAAGTTASRSATNEPKPSAEARPPSEEREKREKRGDRTSAEARKQPRPPVGVDQDATAGAKSRWPWIPTAVGAGAAVAALVCAGIARDRYDALADRSRPYDSARSLKAEGEAWQLASFVLAGAAAVGVGTGLVGFATRGPVTAAATPLPGGGMIALRGELP